MKNQKALILPCVSQSLHSRVPDVCQSAYQPPIVCHQPIRWVPLSSQFYCLGTYHSEKWDNSSKTPHLVRGLAKDLYSVLSDVTTLLTSCVAPTCWRMAIPWNFKEHHYFCLWRDHKTLLISIISHNQLLLPPWNRMKSLKHINVLHNLYHLIFQSDSWGRY